MLLLLLVVVVAAAVAVRHSSLPPWMKICPLRNQARLTYKEAVTNTLSRNGGISISTEPRNGENNETKKKHHTPECQVLGSLA